MENTEETKVSVSENIRMREEAITNILSDLSDILKPAQFFKDPQHMTNIYMERVLILARHASEYTMLKCMESWGVRP